MKRSILPVFIPHLGCPHQCVFCDQKQIAAPQVLSPGELGSWIEERLAYADRPQISFYGGSFTAIDRKRMIAYLEAARPFVQDDRCSSIRLSTRPDAIDAEVLDILRDYGVRTIELGAQSMIDHVLAAAGRGHFADDTRRASRLIRSYGFELILQMMVGLPGSSVMNERETAEELCALQPDGVRIYPTCVLEHTPLCTMLEQGRYTALTVEEAVKICADLSEIFEAAGIPIVRMGLNPTEDLSGGAVRAGAYHPAFGELVYSERFFRRMLPRLPLVRPYEIVVPPEMLSIAIGQKKCNLRRFSEVSNILGIRGEKGCRSPEIRETE